MMTPCWSYGMKDFEEYSISGPQDHYDMDNVIVVV